MRCEDIEPLLSVHIDGCLDPGEKARVEAHLAGCEHCRHTLAELQGTVAMLRGLEPVAPPADLPARVRDGIAARRSPRVWNVLSLPQVRGAMAASILILLSLLAVNKLEWEPREADSATAPVPKAVAATERTAVGEARLRKANLAASMLTDTEALELAAPQREIEGGESLDADALAGGVAGVARELEKQAVAEAMLGRRESGADASLTVGLERRGNGSDTLASADQERRVPRRAAPKEVLKRELKARSGGRAEADGAIWGGTARVSGGEALSSSEAAPLAAGIAGRVPAAPEPLEQVAVLVDRLAEVSAHPADNRKKARRPALPESVRLVVTGADEQAVVRVVSSASRPQPPRSTPARGIAMDAPATVDGKAAVRLSWQKDESLVSEEQAGVNVLRSASVPTLIHATIDRNAYTGVVARLEELGGVRVTRGDGEVWDAGAAASDTPGVGAGSTNRITVQLMLISGTAGED